MLVDHLTDGITQQDHELIERFYLALQLYTVDEIYRYRNPFFA